MDDRQNIIDLYRMACVCVLTEQKLEQPNLEWNLWTSNKVRYMHSMVDIVQRNYTGLKLWRFLHESGDTEAFWKWLDEQRIAYENIEAYAHTDYRYKIESKVKYAILNPGAKNNARIYFGMRTISVLTVLQRFNSPFIVPFLSGLFVYENDLKVLKELEELIANAYTTYGGVEK